MKIIQQSTEQTTVHRMYRKTKNLWSLA